MKSFSLESQSFDTSGRDSDYCEQYDDDPQGCANDPLCESEDDDDEHECEDVDEEDRHPPRHGGPAFGCLLAAESSECTDGTAEYDHQHAGNEGHLIVA